MRAAVQKKKGGKRKRPIPSLRKFPKKGGVGGVVEPEKGVAG